MAIKSKLSKPCSKCRGTGQTPLPQTLVDTLKLFKRGAKLNATAIHAKLGNDEITVSAINGRLEDLRDLGLLQRERSGKHWIYRLA